MKLKTCLIASVIMYCTACNDNTNTQQQTTEPAKDTPAHDAATTNTPIPLDGCYRLAANADTVMMRLNMKDSLVSGDLSYRLVGKDRNDGSIKGVLRDNLIIANYTFRSEGMMSVRQVAFKLSGTSLVEGYGDIDTKGDTVKFKDVNNLTFQDNRPLTKYPCID